MSHTRRRDSQLRVVPTLRADDIGDRTMVDLQSAPPRGHSPLAAKLRDDRDARVSGRPAPERSRREPLASIAPVPSLAPRRAQGSTPPANVIPFAKPRAIASLAAADPGAVVISSMVARRGAIVDAPTNVHMRALPPVAATPAPVPASLPVAPATPVAIVPAPLLPPAPPPPPAVPLVAAHGDPKWQVYEQLGLGEPKGPRLALSPNASLRQQQIAKFLVSTYRLLGFVILTIIVVILVGYITTTAFFYVSDSWVVPMAVTPTDEKVVSLQTQLADLQTQRDRLDDELMQAERSILVQEEFQEEFAKAIRGDLEGRKAALGRVRALANAAAATRVAIKNQSSAYASASRKKMAQEYEAGLIDRNAMLSGKFQLAQITSSNLSLAERQAEFETRAAELESQTRSLDMILDRASGGEDAALSYEVLTVKQELEQSRLDLARAIESRDTLKDALTRQDKMIESFEQSAYLRAVADGASVAFVPYANLGDATKGADLYACKVGMVFCYHVGRILEVLPGEVQFKHPQRDKMLRGKMIELKLDDDDLEASAEDVLFAGGKPLFI